MNSNENRFNSILDATPNRVVYENHNNYSQIFPTVVDDFPFQIKLWPFHPTTQVWSTKLRVKSAGFQHKKINSI